MKSYCTRLIYAFAIVFILTPVIPVQAQSYPSRPIKLLVPLVAGSTADLLSRIIGAELTKEMGQPVIIENKPGAGGTIAMAELARSAPDGYTIGLASQGALIFNTALYAKPGYDPLKDFAPIILAGGVSNVLIVPPNSPEKNLTDVISAAKAEPLVMTYSSGGNGTSHHISGVLLSQLSAIQLQHIPYKGAPQGIMAVMSGEVKMGFYNAPTVISQIKDNKVKALAVTSLNRSSLLPGVPTLDESGVKGYEVNTWFGFIAPAGRSPEIVTKLSEQIGKILAMPVVINNLVEQGFEIAPLKPPTTFAKLIQDDMSKWPLIIKKSGATVD